MAHGKSMKSEKLTEIKAVHPVILSPWDTVLSIHYQLLDIAGTSNINWLHACETWHFLN